MRAPIILLCTVALACAAEPQPAVTVVCPADAPANVKLAAKELRRYVYLRTGGLLPIATGSNGPSITLAIDAALEKQQYSLKSAGESLVISGGSDIGVLYGAYAFAEKLGVRFQIDGDVLPDGRIPLALPQCDESHKPLFRLRGLQPFHDFPEGPDWWTTDDWKSVAAQTAKMRMNFIGLHTYPFHNKDLGPEPTVWIGLPDEVNADGTVRFSAESSWYTTAKTMPYGCYAPGKTGDYHFGAAQLYPADDYGSETNWPDDFPFPKTPAACVALTNRVGVMLKSVFTTARGRGITTCVGTESPLAIPDAVKLRLQARGMDPDAPATLAKLYEGMFLRIKRAYPLDYYWIWGHEGEIDQARFVRNIQAAHDALDALGKPFGLGISGWGWITSNFPALDRVLPADVAFSAINMSLGQTPVSANFAALGTRRTWAIPWLEDDPVLGSIQLRAGRTRRDAVDARAYGCDGLFGIFWRTRILSPNIGALAQAGWQQGAWSLPAAAKEKPRAVVVAGGTTVAYLNHAVAGTTAGPLYQKMRYGKQVYRFAVPNGTYQVILRFAEPAYAAPGMRVFGVALQGRAVIEHLDIFAEAGQYAAVDRTFAGIVVSNGQLAVEFRNEVEHPLICAIEVSGAGVTSKINCGGPAYQDYEADAWDETLPRELPVADFYDDWAAAQFGPQAGPAAAAIFAKLDGQFPCPTGWINGPGAIVINNKPWAAVAPQYAFVGDFAALRPQVVGRGCLERFDWWLHAFQATRAMGEAGCLRGALDATMQGLAKATDPQAATTVAREEALPIRLALVLQLAEVSANLIAMVRNQTELGTLTNVEQQSMARLQLLTAHDAALQAALGHSLPAAAHPWQDYRGPALLTVLTVRGDVATGESLKLPIIALAPQPVKSVTVRVRPLGQDAWQTLAATHLARAVWSATLPAATLDFEYQVSAECGDGTSLTWPATAPEMNQTVVVTE
jgi:hypothetical protein